MTHLPQPSPASLRICAVQFLNARPLFHSLEQQPPRDEHGAPLFELSTALPSDCAEQLREGVCDVALVPVAAYLDNPEWEVVPGIAIGCQGSVETVVLISRVPLEEIERVHLDDASRSSSLMLRVLLQEDGQTVEWCDAPHGEGSARVTGTDAALVIGDAAFGLRSEFEYVYDLGDLWFERTGLPFVFAFWAARPGVLTPAHVTALQRARDRSLGKYAEAIAREYREERVASGRDALAENHYANYLRKTIRYGLETHQREGLAEFLSRASRLRAGRAVVSEDVHEDVVHVQFAGVEAPARLVAARARTQRLDVDEILARASAGGRIDLAEGIYLYEHADTMALGRAADQRRKALHPEGVVSYIVDRNVNYTNVCVTRCKFCNFFVPPGSTQSYVLPREVLAEKVRETEALGGIQILLQGGLNPELRLEYYEELFRWTKANFSLRLHALSPTEILHIAQIEGMSIREVLERLMAAGMDSLPGGGAEILDDEIRNRISPFKNSTEEWLEVMRQAHLLGMRSTATMVFGFQETSEHILLHLDRIRALQDETGGFTAFITWPFQADGTRLKLRDDTSPFRYLRMQALARLYLDNVPNLQVSWPTLGPEIGEIALRFGANDFGSVMIEENVVSQAGATFMLTSQEIERHIRQAGFSPIRRQMDYTWIEPPVDTPVGADTRS
ncbi:MAG: cyclic dehypoxanthinyl futalosine synthase, partial [Nannocystaceae bacterium]